MSTISSSVLKISCQSTMNSFDEKNKEVIYFNQDDITTYDKNALQIYMDLMIKRYTNEVFTVKTEEQEW